MGSFGLFACRQCEHCLSPIPPTYPTVWICTQCEVKLLIPACKFLGRYGSIPDIALPQIMSYLVLDRTPRQRRHFLQQSLLARDSAFHQFTYYSNGRPGNISSTEDILDRILSYL